ncbi:MAG: TRAP transporter small permease [Gammaproteobacteria bacterium]|nr:TRAP transporter small permease [Gammaproteobacteria bacterium]
MTTGSLHPTLARFFRIVTWVENALLVSMLVLMVLLASGKIFFRNVIDFSAIGADPLLRILVLWIAMLGAVAASREGRHMGVDVIARWLPARAQSGVRALTDLFTLSVCLLLAWEAWRFVMSEHEKNDIAFAQIPVWVTELILPVAFVLIALRYTLRCYHHLRQSLGIETPP